MHTIKIEIEDSMYQNMVQNGVDIQAKFREFLVNFVDDGYPAIGTEEAKKRVAQAVERYKSGTCAYLTNDEYETHMKSHLKNLKSKYDNH